jgi:hypothetical protein
MTPNCPDVSGQCESHRIRQTLSGKSLAKEIPDTVWDFSEYIGRRVKRRIAARTLRRCMKILGSAPQALFSGRIGQTMSGELPVSEFFRELA